MSMLSDTKITRRQAMRGTGTALGGVAGLNALFSLPSMAGLSHAAEGTQSHPPDTNRTEKLRIATCQVPVSGDPAENAKCVRDFMRRAAGEGANLLHTSEASLSGYPGSNIPGFENYNWDKLRKIISMSNARFKGPNCLTTLNVREVPTRCADNRMWAVANNASNSYSEWGSFVARPDATIPKQLPINQSGMLIHDYPDTLSPGGWYHNFKPMDMAESTIMHWGTPSNSPRQRDGQSEP